jgi:hypothetical protein
MDWIDLPQVRDSGEFGNDPPGCIKCREFLYCLEDLLASQGLRCTELASCSCAGIAFECNGSRTDRELPTYIVMDGGNQLTGLPTLNKQGIVS